MKKKGFTLIELIGVLVILAIIALIATSLVMSIIRKAKISARKRSIDAYGRSVELAIASYLLDTGVFPTNEQLPNLQIEYSGNKVECSVMNMKKNGGLYLSQCKVNNIEVKDSNEEDGWYHYGTRDLTNSETIEMYGKAIEQALKEYHDINNTYPADISSLALNYTGEKVDADVLINKDGTVYLTNCRVSGISVDIVYGEDKTTAVDKLLSKTNDISITTYTDGNTHEMYTFDHPATEQTGELTDYRYIGANPNNYVTFNDELWRIIGVFTVEDENGNQEQRIKLIRNEKLSSDMAWNSNNVNEWGVAALKNYLNGDYYNSITSESKSMVVDTKYYLGGRAYDSTTHYGTTSEMYAWERGTTVHSGRSVSWVGKIGLMYPSDNYYTYSLEVDNICYNDGYNCKTNAGGIPINGWIYNTNINSLQWLISPRSDDSSRVFHMEVSGCINGNTSGGTRGVRPSLYLASDVKISSGDGSEQNPYVLSMN